MTITEQKYELLNVNCMLLNFNPATNIRLPFGTIVENLRRIGRIRDRYANPRLRLGFA